MLRLCFCECGYVGVDMVMGWGDGVCDKGVVFLLERLGGMFLFVFIVWMWMSLVVVGGFGMNGCFLF